MRKLSTLALLTAIAALDMGRLWAKDAHDQLNVKAPPPAWDPEATGIPQSSDDLGTLLFQKPVLIPPVVAGAKTFRSARPELSLGLREKLKNKKSKLNFSGLGKDKTKSYVSVLLPQNRIDAGVATFEIEQGPWAGVHQCETLGRGESTYDDKLNVTSYKGYLEKGGATPPGIYRAYNITSADFEIRMFGTNNNLPAEHFHEIMGTKNSNLSKHRYATNIGKHWFDERSATELGLATEEATYNSRKSNPLDLMWETHSPGSKQFPVEFDGVEVRLPGRYMPNSTLGPMVAEGQSRFGLAAHSYHREFMKDEDPFNQKNTGGCLKFRHDCLILLAEFVDQEKQKGRAVFFDVREI